jgi:arylsulfatase A-like enzyme
MIRDLLSGQTWLLTLFAVDAWTSSSGIRKTLGKVDHDPSVVDIVQREVLLYVAGMLGIYLLLGLLAGGVMALWRRAMGGPPWRQRLFLVAWATGWMAAHGMVMWPWMYDGPGYLWYAAHVTPGMAHGAFIALGLAWWAWHRWRHRPHPGWSLALAGALAGVALLDARPPAATPRKNAGPNVLIVGFDALRPDHLARFGYERDTAPALEDFLDRAAVYDRAFTPFARTWSAWMSILTGAMPETHGQRSSLPPPGREGVDVPTLAQLLADQGYHTRFMTDDSRFSYMVPEHGFQVIDQPPVGIRAFAPTRYQPAWRPFFFLLHGPLTGWKLAPIYRYNQAYSTTWRPRYFAEHVADGIAEAAEHERFFMAVHACMLHAPADRPYPYHLMYGMGDYRGGNRFRYRSTGSKLADNGQISDERLAALEAADTQQNLDLYDSGVTMVDETWARIERALTAGGLWENTLVIVLSDHGEDFLEGSNRYPFRGPNHGFHPWGVGQHRVLLAVAGPGWEAGESPRLTSLIDVAPTVAAQLGLALPTAEGVPLQEPAPEGRVLFGETGVSESNYWAEGHVQYPFERKHERYTVDPETLVVYQRPEYDEATVLAKDRWALDDEWWLVEEALEPAPRYSLFRWREDPTFADELSDEAPEALEHLKAQLSTRPREP